MDRALEAAMELFSVPIDKPDDLNLILGQSHFIKTVEDVHEVLAGSRSSRRSPAHGATRLVPSHVRVTVSKRSLAPALSELTSSFDGHAFSR